MKAGAQEQPRSHLTVSQEIPGREAGRGDLGMRHGVLSAVSDHDRASGYSESAADLAQAEHVLGDERNR
jgi:hypothetical protein